MAKKCDFCGNGDADVFCEADDAFLCHPCDVHIHHANKIASRHRRFFLYTPNPNPNPTLYPNLYPCSNPNPNPNPNPSPNLSPCPDVVLEESIALDAHALTFLAKAGDACHSQCFDSELGNLMEAETETEREAEGEGEREREILADSQETPNPNPNLLLREARIMRYREKRKRRRFEKTVRYASRKVYAQIRPRQKGRFVKGFDPARLLLSFTQEEDACFGVVLTHRDI